jgi:hypothetical protein
VTVNVDVVVAMAFALFTLALVTGGALRIVWVFLFDEYIGVATPPADAPPPSRFEVGFADTRARVPAAGQAQVQMMTPGR